MKNTHEKILLELLCGERQLKLDIGNVQVPKGLPITQISNPSLSIQVFAYEETLKPPKVVRFFFYNILI